MVVIFLTREHRQTLVYTNTDKQPLWADYSVPRIYFMILAISTSSRHFLIQKPISWFCGCKVTTYFLICKGF